MSENKRKRGPNWLPSEKELLLSLVELHFNIIENKKTDAVTIKSKLAQWKIIADQYNSRTNYRSRTGDTLKAQWESMKKVARKDAANMRKHLIQTGGGSPLPPKKEDHLLQRILNLISTSAVGLFNEYDGDSTVPAVQDQAAIPAVQSNDCPESPPELNEDILDPHIEIIVEDQMCDSDLYEMQENVKKDWGDYTPGLLRTPVSKALNINNDNNIPSTTNKPQKWVSRRRPIHTSSTSLELLHKKKVEAIELQKKLALEEMERAKTLHEAELEIKKEKLRQEKIKTRMLLMRRRNLSKLTKVNKSK